MQAAEAIIAAVQAGDLQQVQALIQDHPELIAQATPNGIPISLLSAYYRKWDVFNWIMSKRSNPTIYEAAAAGMEDKVSTLLAQNPTLLNAFASDGFPPLGLASYFNRFSVVELLVKQGAEVNLAANNGSKVTPLHAAVAANSLEITRLLLENGGEVDALQNGGISALHSAAHRGNAALVSLLLKHGADASLRTEDGRSALDFAQADGHEEVVQLLS